MVKGFSHGCPEGMTSQKRRGNIIRLRISVLSNTLHHAHLQDEAKIWLVLLSSRLKDYLKPPARRDEPVST